ncbi:hypothetical protein [Streptomyces olivochromogenes]|uniref:hypothetical protein n=1 Tax=Streptomyces olivochromogenes TaxID=1963 RepID=UPI0036A3B6CD
MTENEALQIVTAPAQMVSESDMATLTAEEQDGVPVLTARGGTALPSGLTVLDETGKPIATYVIAVLSNGQAATPDTQTRAKYMHPGVYIEELPGPQQITGAGSSATVFVGWAEQ